MIKPILAATAALVLHGCATAPAPLAGADPSAGCAGLAGSVVPASATGLRFAAPGEGR